MTSLTSGFPAWGTSMRKRSPYNTRLLKTVALCLRKTKGCKRWRHWLLLKGFCTDLLVHKLTCSELQSKDSRSKSARPTMGGTNWLISGGGLVRGHGNYPGAKAGKAPLFLCGASSYPAFTCLALDSSTEAACLHSSYSLPKSLKDPHTPNKWQLASVCLVALDKWLQTQEKWQLVSYSTVCPIKWPKSGISCEQIWPECTSN